MARREITATSHDDRLSAAGSLKQSSSVVGLIPCQAKCLDLAFCLGCVPHTVCSNFTPQSTQLAKEKGKKTCPMHKDLGKKTPIS